MRGCLLFLCTLAGINLVVSQDICEGSLGNNIFEGGDFGSGITNLLQQDPGIAPGYQYTLNPPPDDGFYTITSNTGDWVNLFPAWLAIGDNSSDPNGYMMVVNASFDPGIFYEETISGLCESTFYEFSADIINLIIPGTAGHIDPNVDFLIDGVVVYSTGIIPKTGEWNKYGFTFETDGTQSEVRLTLRNNAPGGIGNDLALDNISFRPCGPKSFIGLDTEETVFLCVEGQPVTIIADVVAASGQEFSLFWEQSTDGENWMELGLMNEDSIMHDIFVPGDYFYRYISAADDINLDNDKCRIISDAIHIEVLPRFYEYIDTICTGGVYDFNGEILNEGGIYEGTLISSFGCDSVVTLTLIEVPDLPINLEIETTDPTCFDFSDGRIELTGIEGGYGGFTYYLNDIQGDQLFGDLIGGEYEFMVIDRYGCVETSVIDLINPDQFVIEIGEDRNIILGEEIIINVETNYPIIDYLWSPAGFFSCQNCSDPVVFPTEDASITLMAFNENNCIAEDSFLVGVDRDKAIFIPNIFSPNDDGINDRLEVKAFRNSVRNIVSFKVFNRWGNLVFDRENITLGELDKFWDGKINNQTLPAGVYAYVLEVEYLDGIVDVVKGDVTLIN